MFEECTREDVQCEPLYIDVLICFIFCVRAAVRALQPCVSCSLYCHMKIYICFLRAHQNDDDDEIGSFSVLNVANACVDR